MKKHLRALKRVLDRHFGTVVDEVYWRLRGQNCARQYISPQSVQHPHRRWLLEQVLQRFPETKSLLEVGCASGPNLHLLHQMRPDITLSGLELNRTAVAVGNRHFRQNSIPVTIRPHTACALAALPPRSVDVVLTDAMLVCIAPDRIQDILSALLRPARLGVAFLEWHTDGLQSLYLDHWAHNFRLLLMPYARHCALRLTPLPHDLWGGEWARHGQLVTLRL